MTKVLMISTDAKILEEGTLVRERMKEYGALFQELHIIVFSLGRSEPFKMGQNIFIYPTNSISKLFYIRDAVKIGTSIACDMVSTQDPFETGLAGKKISEALKVPLHIQIHTDFYSSYFKNSLLNKIRISISKKTLPAAKAVRAVSERIRSSLPRDIQERASVLPIFADVHAIKGMASVSSVFNLKMIYPQFSKIVLMASRLTREKGIDTAIEAFEEALKDHKDAGLIIVGEGPEASKIKTTPRVILSPWADHDTLIAYMKTCDVFLSASLYEGYGLSMLEAHAAGATLAVTDAGIAPLLALETAQPNDAKGLARLLSKALSGKLANKRYAYPYSSKDAYLEAYKKDTERAMNYKQ